MAQEKVEADNRRHALKFPMNTLRKRIQPILLRYWGSRLPSGFEPSWIEATEARLQKNSAGPPETEKSIREICETALLQALESMEVPNEFIPEEHTEDVVALLLARLDKFEEKDPIYEQMASLLASRASRPAWQSGQEAVQGRSSGG